MTTEPLKIGLALGGGGAKAIVYLGFLEILERHNIQIDYIAGTSMGAIIGAAYALGWKANQLQQYFLLNKDFNLTSLSNFNFFNESLFKRDGFDELLKGLIGGKNFKDTFIPFTCTAVDLEQKSEAVFNDGPLLEAVKASSAYPPLLPPVFYRDKYLVDGGIIDNVPALLARKLAAANNVAAPLVAFKIDSNILRQYIAGHVFMKHYNAAPKKNQFNIFKRKMDDLKFMSEIIIESIAIATERNVTENLRQAKPELLISPVVEVGLTDFSKTGELIEQGRKLGKEYLADIQKLFD